MATSRSFVQACFKRFATNWKLYSSEFPGYFICPLCLKAFPPESLKFDHLSRAHIVPKYLGGKRSTLACKVCNEQFGHMVEGPISKSHRFYSTLESGRPSTKWIKTIIEGKSSRVEVKSFIKSSIERGQSVLELDIRLDMGDSQVSEEAARILGLAAEHQTKLSLSVNTEAVEDQKLIRQDSMVAFLTCFDTMGYEFIFSPCSSWLREMALQPGPSLTSGFYVTSTIQIPPGSLLILDTIPKSFLVSLPDVAPFAKKRLLWLPPLVSLPSEYQTVWTQLGSDVRAQGTRRWASVDEDSPWLFFKTLYGVQLALELGGPNTTPGSAEDMAGIT